MDNSKHFGYSGLKEQTAILIRRLRSIMFPEIFEECPCTATTIIESKVEAEKILKELIPWVMPSLNLDSNHTSSENSTFPTNPTSPKNPTFTTNSTSPKYSTFSTIFTPLENKTSPKNSTFLPTAESLTKDILASLPGIKQILETDIQAAYDGDPAAHNKTEIMLAYPGFEAISIFRLAHKIHTLGIPYIPRIMTEYAHSRTGIDIHPGATIGPYFFIDHGTGVVIGETTVIGSHVKIYQGVTLGAKSIPVGHDGNPVKGIDRHPKIGNNVIIYSGATILGGDTHIGDNTVIGGNVWLTHSVPANSTILRT